MHCYSHLLAAGLATFFTGSLAYPGLPIIRNNEDILSPKMIQRQASAVPATASATAAATQASSSSSSSGAMQLKLTNQASTKVYAYIMGQVNGKMQFLNAQGTYFDPSTTSGSSIDSASVRIELAGDATQTLTLPGYLTSGRVYFGAEELTFGWTNNALTEPSPVDASSPNYNFPWGIVELDYAAQLLVADLSFVDSVGLALGFTIDVNGETHQAPGLETGSLKKICDALAAVSADWGNLCIKGDDGTLVRALAPEKATLTGSMATLYDEYIDQVWEKFSASPLTIDTSYTGSGSPNVICQVQGGNSSDLVCKQPDNVVTNYAKPTTKDVLGCNTGPFQTQPGNNLIQQYTWPRLCAAFTRATLLLDGGDTTPSSAIGADKYYTGEVVNQYAKVVHETLTPMEGTGAYAFAFDDVAAPDTGENDSGVISVASQGAVMEVFIRGT